MLLQSDKANAHAGVADLADCLSATLGYAILVWLQIMTGVRIDKWLWAARFFKTRTLAAKACELGRVQCNNQPVKAAREVRVGELLQIRTEGGDFQVEVLLLSEIRGPASIAQTLYRETDASRELRSCNRCRERRTAAAQIGRAHV